VLYKYLNHRTDPFVCGCVVLLSLVAGILAADDVLPWAANKAVATGVDDARRIRYGGNPDVMLRPGLLADRRQKQIRLAGEIVASDSLDPIEFLLISEKSGHDYESIAVSFASPLDIYEALLFIGMSPGRPVDYEKLHLWPKGERALVTFEWQQSHADSNGLGGGVSCRAEKLILDKRTKKHMPLSGFCFTGSQWLPAVGGATGLVYAAEEFGPQCIISDYNEPFSIFDVPWMAVDSEIYGQMIVNSEELPPKGQLVDVVIEPEHKDGKLRVVDLTLEVEASDDRSRLDAHRFVVKDEEGVQQGRGTRLHNMLALFERLALNGQTPFIDVRPGPKMRLKAVQNLYVFLEGLTGIDGIRMEPSTSGELFFKSFLPDENWRTRSGRPGQPWELYLSISSDGEPRAVLKRIIEQWSDDKEYPELEVTEYPVADPQAMRQIMVAETGNLPVLLVYAPDRMKYGVLMSFVQAAQPMCPTVYLFLPDYGAVFW